MRHWTEVWFNPDEYVCFSKDKYGTYATSILKHLEHKHKQFVCINPITQGRTRKDTSVSQYRNILVELDSLPKEEQLKLISNLAMPYSTVTDSGGKSLHFVISLAESVPDESYYRQLSKAILAKVGNFADQKTFNPSRFSRLPNGLRKTDAEPVVQKLLEVKERVPLQDLLSWLGNFEIKTYNKPIVQEAKIQYCTPFVKNVLMFGHSMGQTLGRNNMIFRAACDLARQGFSESQIATILEPTTDLDETEFLRTIQSAFQNVMK